MVTHQSLFRMILIFRVPIIIVHGRRGGEGEIVLTPFIFHLDSFRVPAGEGYAAGESGPRKRLSTTPAVTAAKGTARDLPAAAGTSPREIIYNL